MVLGLALSVHVHPSLEGAVDRIDAWHEMERRLFEVSRTKEGLEVEGVEPDLADFHSQPKPLSAEGSSGRTTDKT